MSNRCLVDTNVLVYSVDAHSAEKSLTANALLQRLTARGHAVTTPQVVAEFYSAVTRPRATGLILQPPRALAWLDQWLAVATCADLTETVSREAIRAAYAHQMNIYDAQMWAVAMVYGIPLLVTEDAQFRPTIDGVRYVDPFSPAFQFSDVDL